MEHRTSDPRNTVTFILPVLNRRNVIVRAIESCLSCASDKIGSRVLVVDGRSTDGTLELIEERFGTDERVKIVCQPAERPGFQHAAWFGVDFVGTDLCTYMYSDDRLSPYFVRLAEALAANPDVEIALGYGKQAGEDELIRFEPIAAVERIESERVLAAYYGRASALDGKSMPASPICCVTRTAALKSWLIACERFIDGRPLREHAMVRLAGGPDLMIYLSGILASPYVLRANQVVAQFTATSGSITEAGNREAQLTTGYWLARVWGFEEALRTGRRELAARCAGYVIAVWMYIVFLKLRLRERSWTAELAQELRAITNAMWASGISRGAVGACVRSVLERVRMRSAARKGAV